MIIKSNIRDYSAEYISGFDAIVDFPASSTLFVIDKNVASLYGDHIVDRINPSKLIRFEPIESNKTIDSALAICDELVKLDSKKNTTLVSIGGGITQDVTGFAANILYRGINWVFIPTTLLAQCDSCIGSKTSINYHEYKNLLGTFYPPAKVFINPEFTDTLTDEDYASGLGEMVKYACMQGLSGVQHLAGGLDALLRRDHLVLRSFIDWSLAFKCTFLEIDEFDRHQRNLLNYAHTFGHALESASSYEISHGLAVAVGSVIANRISLKRNLIPVTYASAVEDVVNRIIRFSGATVSKIEDNRYLDAIRKDKKQVDGNLRAVLVTGDAALEIVGDLSVTEVIEGLHYGYSILSQ